MFNDEQFNSCINLIVGLVNKSISSKITELAPTFWLALNANGVRQLSTDDPTYESLVCKLGDIAMVRSEIIIPDNSTSKHRMLYEMGLSCPVNPLAVIMCTEAWSVVYDNLANIPMTAPSKSPNRIECISIVGRTFDGRKHGYHVEIGRDSNNMMTIVKQFDIGNILDTSLLDEFYTGLSDKAVTNITQSN